MESSDHNPLAKTAKFNLSVSWASYFPCLTVGGRPITSYLTFCTLAAFARLWDHVPDLSVSVLMVKYVPSGSMSSFPGEPSSWKEPGHKPKNSHQKCGRLDKSFKTNHEITHFNRYRFCLLHVKVGSPFRKWPSGLSSVLVQLFIPVTSVWITRTCGSDIGLCKHFIVPKKFMWLKLICLSQICFSGFGGVCTAHEAAVLALDCVSVRNFGLVCLSHTAHLNFPYFLSNETILRNLKSFPCTLFMA